LGESGESGAALVEFAIVMLLFLTLLFGIMDAGWVFAQSVEIRNAAREGGRLAVVDYGTYQEIADETCSRAQLSSDGANVAVKRVAGAGGEWESVEVTVTKSSKALTGFIPFFDGLDLSSGVEMRLERELVRLDQDGNKDCP
jgi:Flp pilus assembly protein TadG